MNLSLETLPVSSISSSGWGESSPVMLFAGLRCAPWHLGWVSVWVWVGAYRGCLNPHDGWWSIFGCSGPTTGSTQAVVSPETLSACRNLFWYPCSLRIPPPGCIDDDDGMDRRLAPQLTAQILWAGFSPFCLQRCKSKLSEFGQLVAETQRAQYVGLCSLVLQQTNWCSQDIQISWQRF